MPSACPPRVSARGARSRRTRSHQRPGLLAGLDAYLLRQTGLESLEEGERPSPVAGQRPAAHRTPEGRLRHRLEAKRAGRKPAGLLHLSDLRVGFRATHQHLHPTPAPDSTLRGKPILELGGFGQREPLEKLTRYQLGCGHPVAGCRELLQPVHVQLHRGGLQADLTDRHLHRPLAGVMADDPQRLAQ